MATSCFENVWKGLNWISYHHKIWSENVHMFSHKWSPIIFVNVILYYKNIAISYRIRIQFKLRCACCEANHIKVILCKAGAQDLKGTAFALGQVFSVMHSLSPDSLCGSCLDQDCITQIVTDDVILGNYIFLQNKLRIWKYL